MRDIDEILINVRKWFINYPTKCHRC